MWIVIFLYYQNALVAQG